MKTIRGHFDGNSVVLDELPPVPYKTPVLVQFPEVEAEPIDPADRYGWRISQNYRDGYSGSLSDEVIRQRREA